MWHHPSLLPTKYVSGLQNGWGLSSGLWVYRGWDSTIKLLLLNSSACVFLWLCGYICIWAGTRLRECLNRSKICFSVCVCACIVRSIRAAQHTIIADDSSRPLFVLQAADRDRMKKGTERNSWVVGKWRTIERCKLTHKDNTFQWKSFILGSGWNNTFRKQDFESPGNQLMKLSGKIPWLVKKMGFSMSVIVVAYMLHIK